MTREINCQGCGKRFGARRRDARFCSARCRSAAWRRPPATTLAEPTVIGPVTAATRTIITRCGVDSADNVAVGAMRMARALDDPATLARDLAPLTRALDRVCVEFRQRADAAARAAAEADEEGLTDD